MQVCCFRDKERAIYLIISKPFSGPKFGDFFRHSRNFNSLKLASQNLLPLRDGVSGLERMIQQQKLFDQVLTIFICFFLNVDFYLIILSLKNRRFKSVFMLEHIA